MELKQYINIVWKRSWIPLLLLIVVGLISWVTYQEPPPVYTATMRFIVAVEPERLPDQFNYDGYYAGVSSEYVTDDFAIVVGSHAFAEDVNRHLQSLQSSVNVPPGTIQGLMGTEKQHRILTLSLAWEDPDQLAEIGSAVALAVQQDGPKYLTQLSSFGGRITVLDPPSFPAPIPPSLTQQLEIPLRLLLALCTGIALTFLLEYLDNRIHQRADVEALGVAVLAEVEKEI